MRRNVLRCGAGLMIAAFVAFAAPLNSRADAPAPNKAQAKFEVEWMKGMIDHHHMAVMMAELCEGRAVHPELTATCEEIITTQMAEIEELQSWLLDWYGITYEPQMKPGDERMMERLAQLEGAEFEIAFMEMMVRHHLKAIRESLLAVRRAYHPELKAMAENIIVTQAAEIEEFQEWLCEWYDRCGGPRPNGVLKKQISGMRRG